MTTEPLTTEQKQVIQLTATRQLVYELGQQLAAFEPVIWADAYIGHGTQLYKRTRSPGPPAPQYVPHSVTADGLQLYMRDKPHDAVQECLDARHQESKERGVQHSKWWLEPAANRS